MRHSHKKTLQREIGAICASWRREEHIRMQKLADMGDYCLSAISSFEHGRFDSMAILSLYLAAGMPAEMLKGVGKQWQQDIQ